MGKMHKPKKPTGKVDLALHRFCPECGQPNPVAHSPEWLLTKFDGMLGRIIGALVDARKVKKALSIKDLCYAAYPESIRGIKPLSVQADNTVKVTIYTNRARLHKHGWDIIGPKITGAGYCIVPLERA
jgi:hypothetical protein